MNTLVEALGVSHPWTLGAAHNLATDVSLGQCPEDALSLAQDIAQRAARMLGPRHPQTLPAQVAVAAELRPMHRSQEADVTEAAALTGLTETLGKQHRLTVTAYARSRPVWTFDPLPV